MQPITLKVYYGAEGAPESARPEWLRQVVRIDVPDPDGGLRDLEFAFGSRGQAMEHRAPAPARRWQSRARATAADAALR